MKALLIDDCRNCPYIKITIPSYGDVERLISCKHSEAIQHEEVEKKLHRVWQPFNFCPLPDYKIDNNENE